ncbi:sensor histidine kinase [Bifidobacterium tsurumiense]|uniref:Sensor-like histidine kinase SenX3 n=1 Tax=Bifidobacterium tsurumiense TaxID=356829 RepID=A0A087EC52_9BIFI|nr:HAMP domain-containing sensor histidine kinase [Bifidobacterium tsurumiense]KFJ05353.1 Sensor-like histidine kinase senX3 [Bifidobacterium tsurumiense]MDY4677962.1 HAMP domain-containing sensor histidine kinase [Bifidobacterium tsurumiense]MSS12279.1 HAMP domain-containing histidine kinase [Bifidobacterium tsurumiense]
MQQSGSSLFIFIAFGIIGVAIAVILVFALTDWLQPVSFAIRRWLSAVSSSVKSAFGGRNDENDDSRNDDIDNATATLLSLIQGVTIVVDESGDVIRANPAAYALGVVEDDTITNAEVRDAIEEVRERGGRKQFDITTQTPERYASTQKDKWADQGINVQGVRRPNWLKVTVGRINKHFVVVLIDDVSDIVRFTEVRESFLVNVSEQLLKPTEALTQLADALERDHLDPQQVRDEAVQVRESSRSLNHMVADLMLLMKAQEPIIPSSANRCLICEQLEGVKREVADRLDKASITLNIDCTEGLTVNGDSEQIQAAVTKLVNNAIRYSEPGSMVVISARPSADGKEANIKVIDRGVGISKQDQARIFERFYRGANQTERSEEGMGLGLAIVKHVALTHHGSVSVWSTPGQGSTFTLTLPLAQ